MIHLPLYRIRDYETIFIEGIFKVVQTPRRRYVLDYADAEGKDYFARRMELLKGYLPYPLYPLYKGFHTVSALINNKKATKTYIDSTGALVTWKPKNTYKVVSYSITEKWIPEGSGRLCFAIEPSCEIYNTPIPSEVVNFARVVELGNRRILYDISEERKPNTWIKL